MWRVTRDLQQVSHWLRDKINAGYTLRRMNGRWHLMHPTGPQWISGPIQGVVPFLLESYRTDTTA